MAKEIKIHDVIIEVGDCDHIEILYTPDQQQILEKGKEYKFVFDPNEVLKIVKV